MPGFGAFDGWPFAFGGGESNEETCYRFIVDEYRKYGWAVEEGDLAEIEAHAEASLVGQVFDAAERGGGQMVPSRMLESLPVWEQATGTLAIGSLAQRRAAIAAKFLGYGGNTDLDIDAVCRTMLGQQFVSITYTDGVTYWPGINPGPPGLEWATDRLIVFVRVTKAGVTEDTFRELVAALRALLDDFLPTWMDHSVYTQDTDEDGVEGFVLGVSLLGEAGL